jgi:hypothetical protein
MSVFGFSTEVSQGGDWLPIVKYDARAGRFFRVDRIDTGNGFESNPVDITGNFKALCDFDNLEVGWIDFPPGSAPSSALTTMKAMEAGGALPARPSEKHKNGLRFILKLAKDCGGDKPIREIMGTSKAFLSGVEPMYVEYKEQRAANPGKLPVLMLVKTTPVKTGSGERSSTNYHPTLKIVGWAPRGDLEPQLKSTPSTMARPSGNGHAQTAQTTSGAAPSTGGQRAAAPQQQAAVNSDDFG